MPAPVAIDPTTGDLVLDGIRVPARRAAPELAALGGTWRDVGTGWTYLRVERGGWIATLAFDGERLAGYELYDTAPADERVRADAHAAWLADALGPPPYRFAWGEVWSSYDPRSDASTIGVRFASR